MTYRIPYFFKAYWKDYAWGILFLLGTNLLGASTPLLIKAVIDTLKAGNTQQATLLVMIIAGVVGVMFVIRILSRYFLIGVGRKIEYEVRMALYNHMLKLPRSFYDVQQTGDLMSRLINDLAALRIFLGGGMMLMANIVFAYCTVLPLMAMLSWRLTLFSFVLYPLIIGLMRLLSLRVRSFSHQVQDRLGDLTAVAQENFTGISVIQSYAKEQEESARFYDASERYFHTNLKLVKTRALLYILIALVSSLVTLVVLGEGGWEVVTGSLGLSSLLAFILYLERLAWPTVSCGWILSSTQQGIAALERVNTLFAYKPTITDALADATLTKLPAGPIEIRNLTFAYDNPYAPQPEKPLPPVLRDISFTVQPGETVAIVGPIGSGKTTLLHLLMRLYNPPSKAVLINGIPVEHYPLEVLRSGMTLMPQNAFLFSMTVESNLAYGQPESSLDLIQETAQAAQVHQDIMAFPKAYQTMVGERGVTLSGGQRQRSTMVRTLLVSPNILLLDDPFSNVDSATEDAIIAGLRERRILSEKTTIFVSQRFTLVRQANKIVVLNAAGQVDSIGTHEELMKTSELYRSLNRMASENQEVPAP